MCIRDRYWIIRLDNENYNRTILNRTVSYRKEKIYEKESIKSVSYTHLDVYKRQQMHCGKGKPVRIFWRGFLTAEKERFWKYAEKMVHPLTGCIISDSETS